MYPDDNEGSLDKKLASLVNRKKCFEISKKFKGNKSYLQTKDCVVCGKPFSWRKKWAKNWQQITKCSKRCRAVNN